MDAKEYINKLSKVNAYRDEKVTSLKLERLASAKFMIGDMVIVTQHNKDHDRGKILYVDVLDDGQIVYIVHKVLKNGKPAKSPIAFSMFQFFFYEENIQKIDSVN